jgi:hypothetical protein
MISLAQIEKFVVDLEAFIEGSISGLNARLSRAERKLLRYLLTDLLPKLDTVDGRLTRTARNIARTQIIEQVFDRFGRSEIDAELKLFAAELLNVAGKNVEYYLAAGFNEAKVNAVAEGLGLIRAKIGIDEAGELLTDGYLYRLGQSNEVRQRLKDYTLNALASKQPFAAFSKGLDELVTGSKDIDGVLRSYWRQYAYDTYNQVREVSNTQYADDLNLEWFVYTGGIIKTSRAFCIKRNGKVYNRKQTANWKNDPDLIDKKTKESYNPLIERGRYNCRHFIMWVDEETAQRLKENQ